MGPVFPTDKQLAALLKAHRQALTAMREVSTAIDDYVAGKGTVEVSYALSAADFRQIGHSYRDLITLLEAEQAQRRSGSKL